MQTSIENLASLRRDIDDIDTQLCELLNQRMELSRRVGAYKRNQVASSLPILHPQREREVMEAAAKRVPLAPSCAPAMIYREIMCVGITAYQHTLSLACYSGSEEASIALSRLVRNHFGITAEQTWVASSSEAIEAVKAGHHIAAILPWGHPQTSWHEASWLTDLLSSPLAIIARLPMFTWPFEASVDDQHQFALVSVANPSLLSHPELEGHMLIEPPAEKSPAWPQDLQEQKSHYSHQQTKDSKGEMWHLYQGVGPAPLADESLMLGPLRVIGAWPKSLTFNSVRPESEGPNITQPPLRCS